MRTYVPMNLRGMLTADNIAQELEKVQVYLRQFDGIFNVSNGNPVPGPTPPGIVQNPLDNFFYLPGRPGGQIAYFDTNASGIGVLSSTRNATKGSIYLGSARGSVFDELNSRLGIKTAAPSASLHVKGETPTIIKLRPITVALSNGGWAVSGGPGGGALAVGESTDGGDGDTSRIFNIAGAANPDDTYSFSAGATASSTSGHVLKISAKLGAGAAISVPYTLLSNGLTIKTGTFAISSYSPVISITLSAVEAASITNYGTMQIRLGGVVGWCGGRAQDDVRISWIQFEYPGGGSGGKTAIFQAVTSQTETLSEWQNSAGTSLLTVTAAGRLTVESGGSFRHVPGAAASTLFKGDANGDASWGTVNLLSAYHADTLAGSPVLGDIIVANSTPKWDKLAGNTTTTRKFLRQTGNGTISALPVWDTLVAGDIPALSAAAGWTDDGTVVRLTTNTDQVGIGTTTPSASLGVVNVNNTTDVVFSITGKASQSGHMFQILNSSAQKLAVFKSNGNLAIGNQSSTTATAALYMGGDASASIVATGNGKAIISWGDNGNAIGPPVVTNDLVGCPGARIYLYKDATGQYDTAFGQDFGSTWFMAGDESIPYYIASSITYPGSTFTRASFEGNGDFIAYGTLSSRKNLSAVTPGVPGVTLETTGGGTKAILLRAPSSITNTNTVQLLLDTVGTIPVVGDDPPAVAANALGKVDSSGLVAAVAATNLTNGAKAGGMYMIEYYLETTGIDAGAGTIQFQVNFTDRVGATNVTGTALNLTGAGARRDRGCIQFRVNSGEISYQTNATGAFTGAAAYALTVRVIYLG